MAANTKTVMILYCSSMTENSWRYEDVQMCVCVYGPPQTTKGVMTDDDCVYGGERGENWREQEEERVKKENAMMRQYIIKMK